MYAALALGTIGLTIKMMAYTPDALKALQCKVQHDWRKRILPFRVVIMIREL